jgi:endonuclease YncB( thermonuclease family)
LPLRRPRRIFRPAVLPVRSRRVLLPLSVGLACAACMGALVLAAATSDLFGRAPAAAGQVTAGPAQTAVVDAGTLRLGDRVVRLADITVPPRGRTCRNGAGQDFDCGVAAANALEAMIGETPVDCELHGADRMGRPMGVCQANGRELNRALVEAGWARPAGSSPDLGAAEEAARAKRRGLWAAGGNSW